MSTLSKLVADGYELPNGIGKSNKKSSTLSKLVADGYELPNGIAESNKKSSALSKFVTDGYELPSRVKTKSSALSKLNTGYYASPKTVNNGGVLGGIGYVGARLGLGAFGILEGIWDFSAGGIAKMVGADDWAEEQFANNITGNALSDLDDWYNPSKGWQFAGDVASGIGNSLVGVGVTAGVAGLVTLSGGTLAPAVVSAISASVIGLGAAGQSVTDAYMKTGELGGKEFAYGALSGVAEAGLEYVSGAASKVGKTLFAKQAAKALTKKSVVTGIIGNFAGEAFEEGMSEILDPYFQRWTRVDPNAEKASPSEIGYAAVVGGLSGVIMGGFGSAVSSLQQIRLGNNIAKNEAAVAATVDYARDFANYEQEHNTGYQAYQEAGELLKKYEAADAGDGSISFKQKKLLGQMCINNSALIHGEGIQRSKQKILTDPESFVNDINKKGYTDARGNTLHFSSASEFTANDELVTKFATMDYLGRLLMSKDSFYDLVTEKGKTDGIIQADFRNFQKEGTKQEKASVNEIFGIDVDAVTYEDFIDRIQSTNRDVFDSRRETVQMRTQSKKAILQAEGASADAPLLDSHSAFSEGINVFKTKDGKYVAVAVHGDNNYLYADGNISKPFTAEKLAAFINAFNGDGETAAKKETSPSGDANTYESENFNGKSEKSQNNFSTEEGGKENAQKSADFAEELLDEKTTTAEESADAANEAGFGFADSKGQKLTFLEMKRAESVARNNIKGYELLTEAEKLEVEWTLASAWRAGKSNGEALELARLSTAIGAGVGFADISAVTADGRKITADAVCYTSDGHLTVYINPLTKRTVECAVLHELVHAMEGMDGYSELQAMAEEYYAKHTDEKAAIDSLYKDVYKNEQLKYAEEILPSELTAHYVETVLAKSNMLAKLSAEKPGFVMRCIERLSDVRNALVGMGGSETAEIARLETKFKRIFNSNKGNIADESGVSTSNNVTVKQFSIQTDERGRQYVQADRRVIFGNNQNAWKSQITRYINEAIRHGKENIKITTVEGDILTITRNTVGKAAFQNKGLSTDGFKTKLNAEAHIDELSEISTSNKNADGTKKITPDHNNKHAKRNLAKDGWSYRNAYFRDFDGKFYKLQLSVAIDGTVESVYNIGMIKEKHLSGESRLMPQRTTSVSNNSISEKSENVNSKSEKNQKNFSAEEGGKENAQSLSNFAEELLDERSTTAEKEAPAAQEHKKGDSPQVNHQRKVLAIVNGKYPNNSIYQNEENVNRKSEKNQKIFSAEEGDKENAQSLSNFAEELLDERSTTAEKKTPTEQEHRKGDSPQVNHQRKVLASINGKSPNNSIYQNGENVNSKSEKNQKNFSAEEGGKENAQSLSNFAEELLNERSTTTEKKAPAAQEHKKVESVHNINKLKETSSKACITHVMPQRALDVSNNIVSETSENVNSKSEKSEKILSTENDGGKNETVNHNKVKPSNKETAARRYVTDRSFAEQVDGVLSGKNAPSYDLYIGETPQALRDVGFENKPLLMRNSRVSEILSKHPDVSAELLKEIAQAVADPVMIIKSKTNPAASVVVVTDIQTSKGKMNIPVRINREGAYLDVEVGNLIKLNTNFIASAYGRSTKALVEYAINNNGVLFYAKDKKRVSTLLATHGLQLPARLSTTNFTNSISEKSKNVNSKSEKNQKIFSAEEGGKENAQSLSNFAEELLDEKAAKKNSYLEKKTTKIKESSSTYYSMKAVVRSNTLSADSISKNSENVNSKFEKNQKNFSAEEGGKENAQSLSNFAEELLNERSTTTEKKAPAAQEHKKGDSPQVNHQRKVLAIVNGKSPNNSIYQNGENVNSESEKNSSDVKNASDVAFSDLNSLDKTDKTQYALNRRKARSEQINEDATRNGFIYGRISRRLGNTSDSGSNSSVGQVSEKNLSTVKEKSPNNQRGISAENEAGRGAVQAAERLAASGKRHALTPESVPGSESVLTELPDGRVSFKDVVSGKKRTRDLTEQIKADGKELTEGWQIATTNAQTALERVLRETGSADATAVTNYVRAAKNAAHSSLTVGQYTLDGEAYVGESWQKIWQSIYAMDKKDGQAYKMFNLYLLHWHNTDRYAVGKPVFGTGVTVSDSLKAIEQIEAEYPNFRKTAEKVWKFNGNNLQLAVDGGIISAEYADAVREMYPHYVPTMRDGSVNSGKRATAKKRAKSVSSGINTAIGSALDILPVDEAVAQQTVRRITSARINKMLLDVKNGKPHGEFTVQATEAAANTDAELDLVPVADNTNGGYRVTFFENGKSVTATVSKNVYRGIEALMPSDDAAYNNMIIGAVANLNSFFKKAVTAWNPVFVLFKNPIRDIQTALNYTRYSWHTYAKNCSRALKEIFGGGRYWREAQAAGILSASVYDYRKGLQYKNKGKISIIGKIGFVSDAIEMVPRLAEYISARESGHGVGEALLQAQDVTTNFGRSGTLTKKANATFMPFLNPAVQGFSKMVRAYTGKDAARSWINLIIRSLILGVGLSALNDLLNEDDEDYQNLSDYVKNNNYVLALGDGKFLKIPKGRENGFIGELYLRSRRYASGETDAWDGTVESFVSNLTPTDNFTRTIFSPFVDVGTNTTWYGGTLEGQKWSNTEPKNRYDESTSGIAIWLGNRLNYSPIKIDYLLEQYFGIAADVILPATSLEAETGVISKNLIADSANNSRWSTQFYSQLEKYNYKKTAGDIQAKGTLKYLNSVGEAANELYGKKSAIQSDKSLSNAEKLARVKLLQTAVNALRKEAVTNAKLLYTELGKYDLTTEENFNTAYLYSTASVLGEEYALKLYNKNVYEKARSLNILGVDYGVYFDYYFAMKEITSDKDASGVTVSGSKKKKVIAYTMAQDITTLQKLILIMSAGYKISDGDISTLTAKQIKTYVAKHIAKLNITKTEKAELAALCGLTVKNGRISVTD